MGVDKRLKGESMKKIVKGIVALVCVCMLAVATMLALDSISDKTMVDKYISEKDGLLETFYVNGKEIAKWKIITKGKIIPEKAIRGEFPDTETFREGKTVNGVFKSFNADGRVWCKDYYENNDLKKVEFLGYYKSGGIKEISSYKKGKADGDFKEYYESGKIKSIKTYKDNKANGSFR